MILGHALAGQAITIDLDRLIEGKLLLQANSGGGKSWAIRRLLEQTHGRIQHIVIDVEDEFHTLREKHDYILAGRDGGDCPADSRSAELLARRLLELGMSAVISIYEMDPEERREFVGLFIESMISAPRTLWHPALVVIDEAHIFAPESGGKDCESLSAIIDLQARGRKRGYTGILATQRISKISKDAIAEINNKLIGRSALDVDMKRSADELGFSGKESQLQLRSMAAGEFFAFGPALSNTVVQMRVGPVATTHPKPGQRSAPPTPAPHKVKAMLAQLANLPKEAEEEAHSIDDLRKKVAELQRQLNAKPAPTTEVREVSVLTADDRKLFSGMDQIAKFIQADLGRAETLLEGIRQLCERALQAGGLNRPGNTRTSPPVHQRPPAAHKTPPSMHNGSPMDLTGPEQRILDAIAWLQAIGVDTPEQTAVAFLAGYTFGGGAFNNPKGKLRSRGLVEYAGDGIRLTEDGHAVANPPGTTLTTDQLHQMVLNRLPGPEGKILRVILDAYPKAINNDDCAIAAGYAPDGGAYNNPRGRLRSLGLIDYPERGKVRARDILFL